MGRMHEISPGRQEVTGLGGRFLVGMRTRAVTLGEREIYQTHRAGDLESWSCVTLGNLLSLCFSSSSSFLIWDIP